VLARAALWLLGADRYGDRFWQQLRDQIADAPLASPAPVQTPTHPHPHPQPQPAAATDTQRPRAWIAPRSGWL